MPIETIGGNTTDDYSGVEDTHLWEALPTSNFSTSEGFSVEKGASGFHYHGLMRYTGLSSLPGSATFSDVSLFLYMYSGSSAQTITIRRLLRNWVVGNATYNIWDTSNNWTTAGGLSDGNDRSSTVTQALAINTTAGYKEFNSAQLITDAQNMYDGTWDNDGWHFERTDAADDGEALNFYSTDYPTDGYRPYLSVNYTTGVTYVGVLRRYNGSSWEKAYLTVYNGSAFVAAVLRYYNGSTWGLIDTTGV